MFLLNFMRLVYNHQYSTFSHWQENRLCAIFRTQNDYFISKCDIIITVIYYAIGNYEFRILLFLIFHNVGI